MSETTNAALVERVKGHGERLTRHEKIHEQLWKKIDIVENRVPNWATLFIAVLTAAIGSLGTLIGVML